jgi:uncharacterized protein YlzI (FlbEa/FlbD family)
VIERLLRRPKVEPFDRSRVAAGARAQRELLNRPREVWGEQELFDADECTLDAGRMLRVERRNGSYLFIAADQIETIEPVPGGSMLQLASGRKLMSSGSARETAERWSACRTYRPEHGEA